MEKLCEYATKIEEGLTKYLQCTKSNYPCGYQRWCNTDMCLKMIDRYTDCTYRSDLMKEDSFDIYNEEEKIEDYQEKVKVDEYNNTYESTYENDNISTKKCKIVSTKKGHILQIDGIGIIIKDNKLVENIDNANEVIVTYKGMVNEPDFEIIDIQK